MATENFIWGAPRIYSELLKLGYTKNQVSQRTISRYLKKIRPDNPYNTKDKRQVERFVPSVRNDMLNHMIIFNEDQLRDFMSPYFKYYNNERCHLSVGRDSPIGREIQNKPFKSARIISSPRIGGLHHVYKWDKLLKLI